MSEFILKGLDGSNPLGFLAAVGTMRVVTAAWPTGRIGMSWKQFSGGWRPRLIIGYDLNENRFLEQLEKKLAEMREHFAFSFAQDLAIQSDEFRSVVDKARCSATAQDHILLDFLVAFGSEAIADEKGIISDTAFRTMSGAGHQHFIGFMQQLAKETELDHLRSTLFEVWEYRDDKPSMRWDPSDDRRYALRWGEPSGDPIKTVRGANRLAVEALPLFPTMPMGRRLETTGFSQNRGHGVYWSWPIWEPSICLDVLRSMLALSELQVRSPDRDKLQSMGIVEIFRCQRITQGKYRNFTPAIPV